MAIFILSPSNDILLCPTKAEAEASGLSKPALEGASATSDDFEIAHSVFGSDALIDAAKNSLDAILSAA